MSYLQTRLNALQITEERNSIEATNIDHKPQPFHFFSEDKNGDIAINYLDLNSNIIYHGEGEEQRKPKPFARIRYAQPKDPKRKYYQPKGTEVIPFCTPSILKTYQAKTACKTLYLTEGEFKAFSLSNFGLPCFGIGGIHNFKSKEKDTLHPAIVDFITYCEVQNVVLLFDADCLKVEWEDGKDLSKRLTSFYSAVGMFRELLKNHNVTFYFAHVQKDSEFKGVDDLLYNGICEQNRVIKELSDLIEGANSRKYINTYKVTGISDYKIQQIFWLDGVQSFFDNNRQQLEDKEFVYKNEMYYLDDTGKLSISWKGEQNAYIRIGTDYYKKVVEQSPRGQREINLAPWKIGTIKEDYYKSKLFIKQIQKYDAFTNIPENDPDSFRQKIVSEKNGIRSVLYNRYCPVSYVPQSGKWNNIEKLLHHIFDYKNIGNEPLFEFALDYMQLLYTKPVKKLPVICLVSRANKTGKTTFLNLLQNIFLENMRIIDSDRISNQFNGSYVGKLIVAIDESLIAMDRDVVKNKIKMLTTNETMPLEEKGTNAKQVPNISKLIMCSNDEANFMRIDEQENRYCVIKVPAIPKEDNDPFMLEKMINEIPAFLYFLKHRTLHYEEKSRLYFDEEIFETPALQRVKERTEDRLLQNMKDVIRRQFFIQQYDKIRLSKKVISDLTRLQYRFVDDTKVQDYMNDMGYTQKVASNFTYYHDFDKAVATTVKDRYYELRVEDFLSEDERMNFTQDEQHNDTNEEVFTETNEQLPFE